MAPKKRIDLRFSSNTIVPVVPLSSTGIFLAPMPYQPTKEHLDHQIPDAFKSIISLMRQLKQDIGMDDRYIALMLDALSREYSAKQPIRDGFGFRRTTTSCLSNLLLSTCGKVSPSTHVTTPARSQPGARSERCA